jgi:23S rRNA (uracil1939-C5)-methyltransferase
MTSPSQTREITIHRVGREGQGIGFDEEKNLYFVPGAIPGDVVRVVFEASAKRYRDAELSQILRSSPDRHEPACAHFSECGGCDWLQWGYEAQIKAKEEILRHILKHVDLNPLEWSPMRRAATTLGYRTRVQLRRDGNHIGFFKRRTHDIVAIDRCVVSDPKINEEIARLRSQPGEKGMRKLEMTLTAEGNVVTTWDSPHGAGGFTQTHPEQNLLLRSLVRAALMRVDARRVLELYAGDGNLTFAYLKDVEEVVAVESNPRAVEKAQTHTAPNIRFVTAFVSPGLRQKLPQDFRDHYDTLLLDPPRQGADRSLTQFIHPGLKNIIYVSCSPLTFSQDAIRLVKRGFLLRKIEPIDMFPHTRHIELVAEFSLSSV